MSLIKDACSKRIIVDDDDAPKAVGLQQRSAFDDSAGEKSKSFMVKP